MQLKLITLAFLLVIPNILCDILATAITEDAGAQGAKVALSERTVEVSEDGNQKTTIHKVIQAWSEEGIKKAGVISLTFDSEFDSIELKELKIVGVDKSEKKNLSAYVDKFNSSAKYSPSESKIRDIFFRLPFYKDGGTFEYKLEIIRRPWIAAGRLWTTMVFQEEVPADLIKYEVMVPSNLKIYYYQADSLSEPKIEEEGATKKYVWEVKDIKAAATMQGAPMVVISTTPEWQELAEWLTRLYRKGLKSNVEMRNIAREIFEQQGENRMKTVELLFKFVSKSIKSIELDPELRVIPPQDADDVYENKIGDCKDKVTLMIELLKMIGIEAYPALLNTETSERIEPQLPHPYYFNHSIVYIPNQKGWSDEMWLDPTKQVGSWNGLSSEVVGKESLILMGERSRFATVSNQ